MITYAINGGLDNNFKGGVADDLKIKHSMNFFLLVY